MESGNLVICDREEGYAEAFAYYLMHKKELAFQVQTCSDLSHVLKLQEREKINYLFISSDYALKSREKVRAEKVFVLTDNSQSETAEQETAVYKYQSGEALLAELIRACGKDDAESIYFKTVRKKKAKIIGIFSPIHRIGKTSYALRLGQKFAEEANVLYLNLEIYGGVGGRFSGEGQTLSDVLYYARQEEGNLGLMLTTIVGHKGKLDYVAPIQVSEDIKSVTGREWIELVQKIMEQSIYEIVILDMDEGIREVYQVLQICNEVHMLTADDQASRSKIRQFEEELTFLGYEDIRHKIMWKGNQL